MLVIEKTINSFLGQIAKQKEGLEQRGGQGGKKGRGRNQKKVGQIIKINPRKQGKN